METQQQPHQSNGIPITFSNGPSSGPSSDLLSFSCRSRAESFARKLQLKLKNLGVTTTDTSSSSSSSESPKPLYSNNNKSPLHHTAQPPHPPAPPPAVGGVAPITDSSSSTDSDCYFDFDIGSPGSPVENGPTCFTQVINPCDDLCCTQCSSQLTTTIKGNHTCTGGGGFKYESNNGTESGCVVSTTTSPDNETVVIPQVHSGQEEEEDSSMDIPGGGGSDSDSIYYDVESTSSSSPREIDSLCDDEEPKTKDVEPVCILIQTAAASLVDLMLGDHTDQSDRGDDEESKRVVLVVVESKEPSQQTSLLSPPPPPTGPCCEEEEDEFMRMPLQRIQRSSSLKTGKTPPGTPSRKKIVRFADALGLDLADVRTFLDEIPNVPKSAFSDLKDAMEQMAAQQAGSGSGGRFCKLNKTLLPSFHQPVSMPDYFDKIRDQKVLLENAFLVDDFTIKGTVRVKNMDFHKSVYIRYSYNDWTTFTDFMTTYVSGSCDGFSDKFEFTIPLSPNSVEVGGRVSFACRFHCQGQQFWDNNCGRNYLFHCVPNSSQGQQNLLDFHRQLNQQDYQRRSWM